MQASYIDFVEQLVREGKTSGKNQSEDMIHYTEMSLRRMKRWQKVGVLLPEMEKALKSIVTPQKWTVLTEAWCGDAAHAFMFIEKMAATNTNISFEWKLRDEHLPLMDRYLTNGGRAIPKLIVQDEQGNELYHWGPRPKHIQEKYWELKEQGVPYSEGAIILQKMYNADKGVSMQKEILELM